MAYSSILFIIILLNIFYTLIIFAQPTKSWLYIPKHGLESIESEEEILWCPERFEGSKCPMDDTIFVYYQCCDDLSLDCCANNRIWVKIFLILMPFFFFVIAIVCFWRKCFLRNQKKNNIDVIVDENSTKKLFQSKKKPEFV
uniref:Uncharacterized protein n=1 Tax=Panagrolaimus sp. PS1159 TaxID=55785 RepID=A0AC35GFS9_9BILA